MEAKEVNETVIVERRCVNPVSTEAFDFFLVRRRIRRVLVIPVVIFGMGLMVCLTVIL